MFPYLRSGPVSFFALSSAGAEVTARMSLHSKLNAILSRRNKSFSLGEVDADHVMRADALFVDVFFTLSQQTGKIFLYLKKKNYFQVFFLTKRPN